MNVQVYLSFNGRCEEAIGFYRDVFGAELSYLMRYTEAPKQLIPTGGEEKVFHATVMFGETAVNMSDATKGEASHFGGFALLVHLDTVESAERVFEKLRVGGLVRVPLAANMWAKRYGIIVDRFGVTWKVQVNGE